MGGNLKLRVLHIRPPAYQNDLFCAPLKHDQACPVFDYNQQAELLLAKELPGAFIVRNASQGNELCISIRLQGNKMFNGLISKQPMGKLFMYHAPYVLCALMDEICIRRWMHSLG